MGFEKSIRPTRTTFQGGLHLAGACKLPPRWNGCPGNMDFCYINNGSKVRYLKDKNNVIINFHKDHYFDEVVRIQDAKLIDPKGEAILNHIIYRRFHLAPSSSSLAVEGEYSRIHFKGVYEALERRGLVMPLELPGMYYINLYLYAYIDIFMFTCKFSDALEAPSYVLYVCIDVCICKHIYL